MPIVGLTDRGLALPVIGKIRKGRKKTIVKRGKEIQVPEDLKYFRVLFDVLEKEAEKTFDSIYGDEPNNILIMLPFDDLERVWDAWLKAFTWSRMIGRSDGRIIDYLIDPATGEILIRDGEYIDSGAPAIHTDSIGHDSNGKPIKWKASGILKVILPELKKAAILEVATSSIYDVINITSNLQAVKDIAGRLSYIPLRLKRIPRKISAPGQKQGERMRVEKWLVQIEIEPRWMEARIDQGYIAALPKVEADAPLLLPDQFVPTAIEEEIEAEIVDQEMDAALKEGDEEDDEEENGEVNQRPFEPDDLLSRLKIAAQVYNDRNQVDRKKVTDNDRALINNVFTFALPGSETAYIQGVREVILLELFGDPEASNVKDYGMRTALLHAWFGIRQDTGGEYQVDEHCFSEVVRLYNYLIKPEAEKLVDLSKLNEVPE